MCIETNLLADMQLTPELRYTHKQDALGVFLNKSYLVRTICGLLSCALM